MLFSEERILTRILLQTVGAEMPKPLAPEDKFARVVATRLPVPVADRNVLLGSRCVCSTSALSAL